MTGEIFYSTSLLLILVLLAALLALSVEVGWRFARQVDPTQADKVQRRVEVVQTAVLALLGLLLSFTFAMAAGRYDTRKQFVAQEANAIGTAFLRVKLLSEPMRSESAKLFHEYLDQRLLANSPEASDAQHEAGAKEGAAVQRKLWNLAERHLREAPQNHTASLLYINALNDAFDVQDLRNAALENHVPVSVVGLLFVVSALAMGIVAYDFGLTGRRGAGQLALFGLMIFSVVLTILDLDRPRRGLIRVGQESMQQLKAHFDD